MTCWFELLIPWLGPAHRVVCGDRHHDAYDSSRCRPIVGPAAARRCVAPSDAARLCITPRFKPCRPLPAGAFFGRLLGLASLVTTRPAGCIRRILLSSRFPCHVPLQAPEGVSWPGVDRRCGSPWRQCFCPPPVLPRATFAPRATKSSWRSFGSSSARLRSCRARSVDALGRFVIAPATTGMVENRCKCHDRVPSAAGTCESGTAV